MTPGRALLALLLFTAGRRERICGRGAAIADPGIDPVAHSGLPASMSADNIEMFADFEPQWPG